MAWWRRLFGKARSDAASRAVTGEGFALHRYDDYESYRQVQEQGNKAKLDAQFVPESHILFLAGHLNATLGKVDFALCHGVRRGLEQAWFRSRLTGAAEVIGTDISETAAAFPHTVQWDFHEVNPAWSGRADFVYSNAWDHAYDPHKAFAAWFDALRPGGLMLLDHTRLHLPGTVRPLDPFGATEAGLARILGEAVGGGGRVLAPIDRSRQAVYPCKVFVVAKNA